jgi:hypothetical protein
VRPAAILPALLIPAMVWTQMKVDSARAEMGTHREILYLWSGEQVRKFAPGFESLFADLYWLRTVQYFGAQRAFSEEKDFALLEPLIDITVTLDPRLEMAYRYGAIFLSEPWPTGKGDPKAGVALLERGVTAIPDSWRLRQDLGYYSFLFLKDARRAGEVLREAARLPGAPFWLETLAASILARGGERSTARQMWLRMYEQAEPGFVKDNASYNLQRIDALDLVDAWSTHVKSFHERTGRWPASLKELGNTGLPLYDPRNVPFAYDPATGQVSVARESPLFRSS